MNQVTRIKTKQACERDRTPLALDRKLFRGVFGVVTWHALRMVQAHYDTTKQPFDPCTSVYSHVTSLPCHHIYDKRRQTTGFVPSDFHQHWFWEREQTRVPYLDPETIRPRTRNQQTARNTNRILSTFERVEQPRQTRAPNKCSACHQIGHKITSKNCPLRLSASIAADLRQLQEKELSQALVLPSTPRPTKRIRLEPPDSATTSLTEHSSRETPLALRRRLQNSEIANIGLQTPSRVVLSTSTMPSIENSFTGAQHTLQMGLQDPEETNTNSQTPSQLIPNRLDSPTRTFQAPLTLNEIDLARALPNDQEMSHEELVRVYNSLGLISTTSQHQFPTYRPPPPKPLAHTRPEMTWRWYIKEKEEWLANHPNVSKASYQKARDFKKLRANVIREERRRMPEQRRLPNGEVIEQHTTWSEEEIFAWLRYQQKLQDDIYVEMQEEVAIHGWQSNTRRGNLKLWKEIEKESNEEQRHFTI